MGACTIVSQPRQLIFDDMKNALEVGRNIFEHFRSSAPSLLNFRRPGRTDTGWLMNDCFLRQVLGQGRAARRLAALGRRRRRRFVRLRRFGLRFLLAFCFFDIADEQFELFDFPVEFL